MDLQYVVIEGVIGVGKTTLAKILGARFNARLILEQHEENPFLKDFYRDPRHYAFQTQLFFLLSRYKQQQEFPQRDLFQQLLLADYLFAKDRLFAHLTLDTREITLYERVMSLLERNITKPDLVIYLQSNTKRLMGNIRKRGRDYEKSISEDYIRALNESYNQFFFNYRETPLLIIDTSQIDFVHNSDDLEDLIREILRPHRGTRTYVPRRR